ncbi:MAG: acyl-phosphate glycerol 3-phosphate acyltransferase [Deltaproteobacteria bacterium]|nr:acyl-phosphate glycerol 3-phosphate acyltransferase [Deltaproteobacteria bacterium]MBW2253128.1 acyl-phosphate glycerol 3-phosphate acyltransferase [Deltaproteobacteria bacterium]
MLLFLLVLGVAQAASVEEVLSSELDRAMAVFSEQDEKPHYAAVVVEDREQGTISARDGALSASSLKRERLLDVDIRVGDPALDSTHQLRGFSAMEGGDRRRNDFPLDDAPEAALRHEVWKELDRAYRDAAERIVIVRANLNVKVEEESPAPDFTLATAPTVDHREVSPIELDRGAWETTLVEISERLDASPVVHRSSVSLASLRVVKTFVDTEGTRLVHGTTRLRMTMDLSSTAPDGDVVRVFRSKDLHRPEALPAPEELEVWADEAVARLEELVQAPRGQPYSGPVILAGKAAGVFIHEVLGHRVEGHRQKREDEGKTFADYVGRPILPEFIDVFDDPTVAHLAGHDLNGFYVYDDEGTRAQRADLVDDGIFVGFLMGRSPIPGFDQSNGHARRMAGRAPLTRMGNTIVEARRTVSDAELRKMLLAEVRAQGLEYGVVVEEIDGGFTLTGRQMPNAFNVRASASWRVYADGRPDELVRGIDLVGTPFAAFSNLIAASDSLQVFNGHCGAESGWVPVSSVAPNLLFQRLEFQLKEKQQERPPLLAKPMASDDGAAEVAR